MAIERTNARGSATSSSAQGLRPLDYFLIGVCVVALIAVGVIAARSGSFAEQAAAAQRDAKKLTGTIQELQTQVQQLNTELQSLKGLNGRLATLETRINEVGTTTPDEIRKQVREVVEEENRTRQTQFRAEMQKRGEEFVNQLATDKQLEQGLRDAAERLRKQNTVQEPAVAAKDEKPAAPGAQADAAKQNVAEEKKAPDPVNEGVAKGAETFAQGMKLWRDFQAGKITKEEFDAQRKGLEEGFRAAMENVMTPAQREQMQKRMQEWRNRRPGGGGGAAQPPPRPADEKF